jgi:hypothetical protein
MMLVDSVSYTELYKQNVSKMTHLYYIPLNCLIPKPLDKAGFCVQNTYWSAKHVCMIYINNKNVDI